MAGRDERGEADGATEEETSSVLLDKRSGDSEDPDETRVDDAADRDDAVDETDEDVDDDRAELDDDDDDDDGGAVDRGVSRPAFFATLGVAIVAILGVLFVLGAFVWPAFLGPGSPDARANEAISALSAKDPAKLDGLACKTRDGAPASQFPPELIQLVSQATMSGPPNQVLDSEARAPVDITFAVGGQQQALPLEMALGTNDGDWCLKGFAQRQ